MSSLVRLVLTLSAVERARQCFVKVTPSNSTSTAHTTGDCLFVSLCTGSGRAGGLSTTGSATARNFSCLSNQGVKLLSSNHYLYNFELILIKEKNNKIKNKLKRKGDQPLSAFFET